MNEPKKLHISYSQTDKVESTDTRWEKKINYEQGTEAGQVQFMLICEYLPVGTVVGFNSDKPGPQPPIKLEPAIVNVWPNFVIGIMSYVPADYKCVITY